jgi:uncharacterized protein with GYD domain
MPSYVLLVN